MLETQNESSRNSLSRKLEKVDVGYLDTLWRTLANFMRPHLTESISLPQVERLTGVPTNTLGPIIYLELQVKEPYNKFVRGLDDNHYLDLQGKLDNFPNCRRILEGESLKAAFLERSASNKQALESKNSHTGPRLIGTRSS